MAVPKYDELMKPLLMAVKNGEVYKIKDVTAASAQQLHLSSLLDSPVRASVVITDAGRKGA